MVLIKSISGIRGTIGGYNDENLNPIEIIRFTSSYITWIKEINKSKNSNIVIGRDSRISGDIIINLVTSTVRSMGLNIIDLNLTTTPTLSLFTQDNKYASGGIMITASHNPIEWNALKLFNDKGEFISNKDLKYILSIYDKNIFEYSNIYNIGTYRKENNAINYHINKILQLPIVNCNIIKNKNYTVCIDCVNSSGNIIIPELLKKLNVNYTKINDKINGFFNHNPEPINENITQLSLEIKKNKYDLGVAVDPDVDRLALIDEKGDFFGEEYTIVAVADYILQKEPSSTISNISSSLALKDLTERYGQKYHNSKVGEYNVIQKMKEYKCNIGGEGNGGVIYSKLHYGRDALVGIAIILSYMAESNLKLSEIKNLYPNYFMLKEKIVIKENISIKKIENIIKNNYSNYDINYLDGIKINMNKEWILLRKSNTEPIIRIYIESLYEEKAYKLYKELKNIINNHLYSS